MRNPWINVYRPNGTPVGKMRHRDPMLATLQRAGYICL